MLSAVTNARSADLDTACAGAASLVTLTGGLGSKAERVEALRVRGMSTEEACDSAASLGAVPALVAVLTTHASSLPACASACAALRNLVGGRTPLAHDVAAAGGVPPLLAALSAHGDDEALARAACGAIQNLAFYKELGSLLKANGAAPRLAAASAAHAGTRAVAAEALKRLGRDERGALVDASLPGRPPLTSVATAPLRCYQGAGAAGGGATTLGALWANPRPVVLIFLRRLGCKLCRVYAQDVEALRVELGDAARVVCLTFERFGEGSDAPPVKGGSFEEGAFFKGDMYQVMDQAAVYGPLFGRKGFADGYGLVDALSDKSGKLALANARGVTGNLEGDGFQLGGQFVVMGGFVVLDKRQEFYGDDATVEELRGAVRDAIAAPVLSFRAPGA